MSNCCYCSIERILISLLSQRLLNVISINQSIGCNFPSVKITGYVFYWTQAVWKKLCYVSNRCYMYGQIGDLATATYILSKYLTNVLKPLTDESRHKLQSTENFIDAIKTIQIPDDHKLVFFDVKSLFTSIPLQLALGCTGNPIKNSTVGVVVLVFTKSTR